MGNGHYAELQRKKSNDIDDEALRPNLPVKGVMGGMFQIASRIFGITITEQESAYYESGSSPDTARDGIPPALI